MKRLSIYLKRISPHNKKILGNDKDGLIYFCKCFQHGDLENLIVEGLPNVKLNKFNAIDQRTFIEIYFVVLKCSTICDW